MARTLGPALHHALTLCLPRRAIAQVLFVFLIIIPAVLSAQDPDGVRPLRTAGTLQSIFRDDTRLLDDAHVIECLLVDLDGAPPNWKEIYGDDGAGHDDRLFVLNRERDRLRMARQGLSSRLTFLWSGELSSYDSDLGGFHVAIGPKLIPTRWGVVRFKPENLPSNLIAVPPAALEAALRARVTKGEQIEIDVVITGRLITEESIIYDFAHGEPGQGMVMPVVRVERMDYILKE